MATIEELIGQASIFAGLAPEHLELIAGCGQDDSVDAGAFLFHRANRRSGAI